MVFHYPLEVDWSNQSGSTLRPRKMIEAFKLIGFDVINMFGPADLRRQIQKSVVASVRSGERVDFVYMETPNIPITISSRKHWPPTPFLDFGFLRRMKSLGVPIGVFIRDLFWRFDYYSSVVPLHKRMILRPLFCYDYQQIANVADVVFVPSLSMQNYLPSSFCGKRIIELPPGADPYQAVVSAKENDDAFTVIYVGGVAPPVHDISPLLEATALLRHDTRLQFLICCYGDDWKHWESYYIEHGFSPEKAANVSFVHLWGEGIHELYTKADLSVMISKPCDYLDIAMPIKVFEALGYGMPMIANEGTPFGRFVEDNGIGWAVKPTGQEVATLIMTCVRDRSQLAMKRDQIAKIADMHTWEARARRASEILAGSAE